MPETIKVPKASYIVLASGEVTDKTTFYVWDEAKLLFPYGPSSVRVERGNDAVSLSSIHVDDTWDDQEFYIFYVADCAFPTFHAIQAGSWEEAYDVFVEQEADRGHYLIEDGDPDYGPDDGTWTDDGRRVDTESFQGFTEPYRVVCAGVCKPPMG